MFYSQSTGGFYSAAIHGDNMPADAVEITPECHAALLEAQSSGKRISVDDAGHPIAIDPPAPSTGERALAARSQRDAALSATDWLVTRHRDEMEAGDALTLQPEQYATLQAYRTALRNFTSQAGFPDVGLPTAPAFVNF